MATIKLGRAYDVRFGWIEDISDSKIVCMLRKDNHLDRLIVYPKSELTEQQRDMVCLGLCVSFNLDTEEFKLMNNDNTFI